MKDTLVYGPTSDLIARSLLSAQAYCIADDMTDESTWFTWKSHILAPVYTDCRVLARDPGATSMITTAMGSAIRALYPDAEYIVSRPDPRGMTVTVSRERFKDSPALPPLASRKKKGWAKICRVFGGRRI